MRAFIYAILIVVGIFLSATLIAATAYIHPVIPLFVVAIMLTPIVHLIVKDSI